ncbi:MAG: hypothetical protein ACYTAN_10795 [Planctomycetota bacterium]
MREHPQHRPEQRGYPHDQVEQVGASEIGFVLPEGLTVINPDGIAILKGAPNEAAARAFVEFVLSRDGQKLWYLKAGSPGGPKKSSLLRMPVRTDLYEEFAADSPVRMNPFKHPKGFTYDPGVGTVRYEALNDLIGAVIVDCHSPLVKCWKKMIQQGRHSEALKELSAPPVTEDSARGDHAKRPRRAKQPDSRVGQVRPGQVRASDEIAAAAHRAAPALPRASREEASSRCLFSGSVRVFASGGAVNENAADLILDRLDGIAV